MDKLLLTPIEAATALGIGRSKVYELMQTGQLQSVHIGACRRVPGRGAHCLPEPAARSQLSDVLRRSASAVHNLSVELRRTG